MDADDRKVLKDLRNLHLGRASRVKTYSVHRRTKAGRDQELIVELYDEVVGLRYLPSTRATQPKRHMGTPTLIWEAR
jgi:hypothetical protein